MENNRFAVGAQLDVAFNGEAPRDGRLRRAQRVFDHAMRAVVQAAMGDWTLHEPGRSVDRRQASISNTASISASELRKAKPKRAQISPYYIFVVRFVKVFAK
jgi:hypothetical protein